MFVLSFSLRPRLLRICTFAFVAPRICQYLSIMFTETIALFLVLAFDQAILELDGLVYPWVYGGFILPSYLFLLLELFRLIIILSLLRFGSVCIDIRFGGLCLG